MEKIKTRIIEKILHKENDFCCLCLKTFENDQTHLDDDVVLLEYEADKAQKVSDTISYVFGSNELADVTNFGAVCLQCASAVANCYKFMKEARNNLKYLNSAVENLTHSFDGCEDSNELYDSLFLVVDKDFEAEVLYYHHKSLQIYNKSEALTTFECIAGLKEEEQSIKKAPNSEKEEKCKKQQEDKKEQQFIDPNKFLTVHMSRKKSEVKKGQDEPKMGTNKEGEEFFDCKECLKQYPTVQKLRSHILRVHEPKNYKCTECSRSYSTKSLLKIHQANSHISLVCAECGKSCNNISTLRTHEKSHYMRYVCQDCGRVYKNQSTFKKHIDNNICQMTKRHSPADAKFECDYCGKKYTQKITLRVHIQYEHGNKKYIECKWCNKKFWCQSRLKVHVVKHTKEKNFLCTICNGKFVTKESLIYHTRIHTGEKPYPCDYCDSKFISASRKQAHIKSHHMNVTVECDVCYSKFKSPYYLNKHKKMHERPDKMDGDRTLEKDFLDSEAKNMDQIKQNLTNFKEENTEQGEDVNFLQGNMQSNEIIMYNIKDSVVQSDQYQRLVYNIVESEAVSIIDGMELKKESIIKDYNHVELVVLHTDKELNKAQIPENEEQVYFEEDLENDYEMKVSENVEI